MLALQNKCAYSGNLFCGWEPPGSQVWSHSQCFSSHSSAILWPRHQTDLPQWQGEVVLHFSIGLTAQLPSMFVYTGRHLYHSLWVCVHRVSIPVWGYTFCLWICSPGNGAKVSIILWRVTYCHDMYNRQLVFYRKSCVMWNVLKCWRVWDWPNLRLSSSLFEFLEPSLNTSKMTFTPTHWFTGRVCWWQRTGWRERTTVSQEWAYSLLEWSGVGYWVAAHLADDLIHKLYPHII